MRCEEKPRGGKGMADGQTEILMRPIARIQSDFSTKFGIPRQSGLVPDLRARIVFEPVYRDFNAVRGLEQYSHIWLLWLFSAVEPQTWSATVRPPRLGGEKRVGVFASRSPFRPNRLGLSVVQLLCVGQQAGLGPILEVAGADLLDGTPILDIKPYLAYCDSHPQASGGITPAAEKLQVVIPDEAAAGIPPPLLETIRQLLAQDPRPGYSTDAARIFGFFYAGYEIHFRVQAQTAWVVAITAPPAHRESSDGCD